MKLSFKITLVAFLLSSFQLFAQAVEATTDPVVTPATAQEEKEEEEPGFSLTGYVDAYYQGNVSQVDGADGVYLPFGTSFTGATNTFGIGNVNLLAEKTVGKVGFVGQVGFGPRATQANGGFAGNFASTVQQLFVTYSPSDAVTFTLGNFGTFVGYEVIDAPANMNYSVSYLFSNGPFFHTGAKADFALGEKFGAMIGVFNDTDSKIDGVAGKHLGAQLSTELGGLSAYLNVLTGKEAEGGDLTTSDDDLSEFQVDLTATYAVSETFSLGLNVSSYSQSFDGESVGGFFGTALYATVNASETATVSLRGELFSLTPPEGVDIDTPSVLSLTASAGFSVGDLRIIPEVRFDSGSNGFFNVYDSDTYGVNDESVFAFILAGVYSF
ncbi:outer membrane beta-barrel protein [Neolewinella lacunae]|uniref:Porin n=1 Tax=Neolewinella lacunae TaxID=1517758 RepID=A0A923T640_9BACT|nr:outer membrane beta-barrel protein [Neolewinella lacunae]MBC6993010.1 porin [Neolewinella lacunae]MDN3635832.1 outer membrane beta-barrel protein [Neolewinella lacunae]